jgi:hypothetical protein
MLAPLRFQQLKAGVHCHWNSLSGTVTSTIRKTVILERAGLLRPHLYELELDVPERPVGHLAGRQARPFQGRPVRENDMISRTAGS